MMRRLTSTTIQLLSCMFVLRQALRYLDPGSGSLIIQILVALILGLAATFRLWKDRVLTLLRIKKPAAPEQSTYENPEQQ
jgi:hypothetical protein